MKITNDILKIEVSAFLNKKEKDITKDDLRIVFDYVIKQYDRLKRKISKISNFLYMESKNDKMKNRKIVKKRKRK